MWFSKLGNPRPRYAVSVRIAISSFNFISELESKHATRDIRKSTLPLTVHISHVASFLRVVTV